MLSPFVFTPRIQRVTVCSFFWLDATSKDSWQYAMWQVKAKQTNKKACEFNLKLYIFARNLILGEKKIQSALHICISMDSIEGWKIFGKKIHEIPKNTTLICHSSSTIYIALTLYLGFPGGSDSKESACNAGDMVWSMDQEDPLEKEMATHSSTLAWRIPWREEPGGLQSMGLQRVGHNWAANTQWQNINMQINIKLWSSPLRGKIIFFLNNNLVKVKSLSRVQAINLVIKGKSSAVITLKYLKTFSWMVI